MRIMLIYERAVTRFKGDLELWLRYAEYCRSQGSRRVQKVVFDFLKFIAWCEHYLGSSFDWLLILWFVISLVLLLHFFDLVHVR